MKLSFLRLGVILVVFLCAAWPQDPSQQKSADKSTDAASSAEAAKVGRETKSPVKPTPENLAEAKKVFGYDCAMCHGAEADGKGDLAASMGLKMNDWRDSSKLASLTDGEIFETIVKGKGRMVSEGDRYSTQIVWELVNYVRTFEKNEAAAAQKTGGSR
jgi:mono/diheme cytochrome c family protein